jgi:hypothetical protein
VYAHDPEIHSKSVWCDKRHNHDRILDLYAICVIAPQRLSDLRRHTDSHHLGFGLVNRGRCARLKMVAIVDSSISNWRRRRSLCCRLGR